MAQKQKKNRKERKLKKQNQINNGSLKTNMVIYGKKKKRVSWISEILGMSQNPSQDGNIPKMSNQNKKTPRDN